MSASMATTGPLRVAYLANSDDNVVLPLPPLPTNATRIMAPDQE